MNITRELQDQTQKILQLIHENRIEDAKEEVISLQNSLQKVEVFTARKFKEMDVVREKQTGYMVKVKQTGHSGHRGWGLMVQYLNPDHEPTGENIKPLWRSEDEFEKANQKQSGGGKLSDDFLRTLKKMQAEKREEVGLYEAIR